MKKLILITLLSFVGVVFSNPKYPYIAKHYPPESQLPKQCEENDPMRWGNQFKDIAASCARLDLAFPLIVNAVAPVVPPLLETRGRGSIRVSRAEGSLESLIEKRRLVKEVVFAKRNIEPLNNDVDAILIPLNLSEHDKQKEKEYLKTYLLLTAEYDDDENIL